MRLKSYMLGFLAIVIVVELMFSKGNFINSVKADWPAYLLLLVGAFLVYGTNLVLKWIKQEENIKAMIGIKFGGLGIAIIGMLMAMKFI